MEKIIIPQFKFLEMANKCYIETIAEKNRVAETTHYLNREYINTGGWFDPTKILEGQYIDAYLVTDLALYRGALKPLNYSDHFNEVSKGRRERSYISMQIWYKRRTLVCIEKVRFEPQLVEQMQLNL